MICCACEIRLIPSGNFMFDEMGYSTDDGNGIVTIYNCPNEKCTINEIYTFEPEQIKNPDDESGS